MEINHCKICKKEIESNNQCCSRECRNKLLSETKKKRWAEGKYINWTDKRFRDSEKIKKIKLMGKRISETRKIKFKKEEIINWTDKSIRTIEIQQKINDLNIKRVVTGRANGMFDWNRDRKKKQSEKLTTTYENLELRKKISELVHKSMTPEVKKQISNTLSKMIVTGEFDQRIQKGYKYGYYYAKKGKKSSGNQKLFYRSSLELKWFNYLDQNTDVLEWIYEGIQVPLEDGIHHTVVDLDIYYVDGSRKIVEIKAFRMIENSKKRIFAVKKYCNENNLIFEVWTENEMLNQDYFR